MRAVQVREFGGPEVLELVEVATPQPDPAEVVVDVAVADVMFLDTRLRAGWGQDFFPLTLPYIPGGAIGGVVSAVGAEVDPRWLGKRGAERLVVELRDKVDAVVSGPAGVAAPGHSSSPVRDQVVEALLGLGFPAKQAEPAVDAVLADDPAVGTAQALRSALVSLGRSR